MTPVRPLGSPEPAKAESVDPQLKHVAEEFEGIFLRQLLQNAKVGGKDGDHGYGAMAVDALASGIQAGGGLGLARAIEQSLARSRSAR